VTNLAAYANLPDPPQSPDDVATAQHLTELIGPKALEEYRASCARDRDTDRYALQLTAEGPSIGSCWDKTMRAQSVCMCATLLPSHRRHDASASGAALRSSPAANIRNAT
jgi:hypothetical protein